MIRNPMQARPSPDKPARSALAKILAVNPDGFRACIPIIGTGLNLQASKLTGNREDDWAGLLERIACGLNLSPGSLNALPKANLFRWESMLRLWARVKRVEPFEAEDQLQKLACAYLRSLEAGASERVLYREFSSARFADILSLNFDRRLALSFPKAKFKTAGNSCPEGPHGESLYRHDLLEDAAGFRTRVWYPHGDTKKYSTLKLGIRKYGFYVGTIEETQSNCGDDWRFKRSWDQMDNVPVADQGLPKWTEIFLGRPLIFVGCGLSSDEWPLWSMLRRRAAQDDRYRESAFFVTGSAISSEHQRALADHHISLLGFSSFDQMWDAIRSAIA